jgi:hypothetical protein
MKEVEARLSFLNGLQSRIELHIDMIKMLEGNFPDMELWYQYKINRYSQIITRYSA